MTTVRALVNDTRGNAAVEMALVLPLLLIIMFGAAELGNYFMNEHSLVKAVRDGARFAARQSFSNYTGCGPTDVSSSVVTNTRNVVMYGYMTTGPRVLTPNISAGDISVTTGCATTVGGQSMLGIYRGRANGAQIVTVSATVNYLPILSAFGFRGIGAQLKAESQAAVAGI